MDNEDTLRQVVQDLLKNPLANELAKESLRFEASKLTPKELLGLFYKNSASDSIAARAHLEMLEHCGGNVTTMARELNITRATLYGYLKKYGTIKTKDSSSP